MPLGTDDRKIPQWLQPSAALLKKAEAFELLAHTGLYDPVFLEILDDLQVLVRAVV